MGRTLSIEEKMYGSRRAALQLFGVDDYQARVAQYRPIIKAAMQKMACSEIDATQEIAKVLTLTGNGGIPVMLVLATCTEMLEHQPA